MRLPRLFLLACTVLLLAACGEAPRHTQPALPPGATVLVVGDSLVAGTGATREQSWPAVLQARSGWNVVNAGVPGHTSADARSRLDGLLDQHRPDAVIIAIGGNDFLRKVALDTTRANIEAMVAQSKAVAGHVAIVAIPAPSVGASLFGALADHRVFGEIAQAHAVALVPDAVSRTLSREDYRADRIHANASGYAFLAEQVAEALSEAGWLRH